jgi:hypothetical protein
VCTELLGILYGSGVRRIAGAHGIAGADRFAGARICVGPPTAVVCTELLGIPGILYGSGVRRIAGARICVQRWCVQNC